MLAGWLGWTGALLIVVLNVPQVWRTCVHGRSAGVPASRASVALAVALLWLGYGLYGGGLVQVVLNVSVIVLNVLLLRRLGGTPQVEAALVLLGVLVVAVGTVFGRLPLGVLGAAAAACLCLPQLLALRGADDVDGVSRAALLLQGAAALCWIGYGGLRHEAVVLVPNVVILLSVVATLALLRSMPLRQARLPQAA